MKLRDMMFLVIGGLLVISGMVLNSLLSGNADAQEIQIEVAKRVTDDNSRHIKGFDQRDSEGNQAGGNTKTAG